MCYLPSVIATATMLLIISSVKPCIGLDYQTEVLGILGIDKVNIELLMFFITLCFFTSEFHC